MSEHTPKDPNKLSYTDRTRRQRILDTIPLLQDLITMEDRRPALFASVRNEIRDAIDHLHAAADYYFEE